MKDHIDGLNRALQEVVSERDRVESAWHLQQNLLKKQKDERDSTRDLIIGLRQYVVGQDGSRAGVLERIDAILERLHHG